MKSEFSGNRTSNDTRRVRSQIRTRHYFIFIANYEYKIYNTNFSELTTPKPKLSNLTIANRQRPNVTTNLTYPKNNYLIIKINKKKTMFVNL